MLVEMTVKTLVIDPLNNAPVVVLRDAKDDMLLPIWIGAFEANAIALLVDGITSPRPMLHDLVAQILATGHDRLSRAVIGAFANNAFHASIEIEREEGVSSLEARPSDAITLALATGAPIYVDSSVLHTSRMDVIDRADLEAAMAVQLSKEDPLRNWTLAAELSRYKM